MNITRLGRTISKQFRAQEFSITLTDSPNPADVIGIFVMGLVCFVPFALFLRGVVANSNH